MKTPTITPSIDAAYLAESLKNASFYQGQIMQQGVSEAKDAEFLEPERPMHESLRRKLGESNIASLYTHQAAAFDLAAAGKHVLVTSGTSSGKTLCYALPAVDRLLKEPAARAIFIFPTKALAQDQLGKLKQLCPEGIVAATYDGDTPKKDRAAVRANAHIILTNPDMLHVGILPNYQVWNKFLKNLRFVVLDEMHTYSGVFGSHVALIMRRMRRICDWMGSRPQFIGCSATIANGPELFETITGIPPEHVSTDGSARGKRTLLLWNPPEVTEGVRRSPNSETAQLLGSLAVRGVRTLAFAKSRITAELVLRYTREGLMLSNPALAERIESYRAGYTPAERRDIERRLFNGDLLGLSSTDAMELGVDVGALDAVVMNGYPNSISSLRQQAGRAGRGTREALAILVAHDNPLDQFYMRHPEILLAGKAEAVRAHPRNPFILAQQLRCAAHERPLTPTELSFFPEDSLEVLEALEEAGLLRRRSGMWFPPTQDSPASSVDIRGDGSKLYAIEYAGETLGTMEEWRAFMSAHPGAIYLHRGHQYLVRALDIGAQVIDVEPVRVDYYTQSVCETTVDKTVEIASASLSKLDLHLQGLRVTTNVAAFKKKSLLDDSVLGVEELHLPPNTIDTLGLRLDLPADTDEPDLWLEGVHAMEHLLVALAPTIAQCEPRDLGSAYYAFWPETGRPAIFVFDAVPGGIGLSDALFRNAGEWLARVEEQLTCCPCAVGCPSCILSPRCPYSNEGLDKAMALDVVRSLRLA